MGSNEKPRVLPQRLYYSNAKYEGKLLLFLLCFESQCLLVPDGCWKWQETGFETKAGSKLDCFMVLFSDRHFPSCYCLSKKWICCNIEGCHFSLCLLASTSRVSVKPMKVSSALSQSSNHYTTFYYAFSLGCLFISSFL